MELRKRQKFLLVLSKVCKLGGLHTPNANIHLGFIQVRNMDNQDITKALLSRINQIYY